MDDFGTDVQRVVDGHHVRMCELGERLGLSQQPSPALVAIDAGTQELEGNLAIELGIIGGIHHAHASGAEPA